MVLPRPCPLQPSGYCWVTRFAVVPIWRRPAPPSGGCSRGCRRWLCRRRAMLPDVSWSGHSLIFLGAKQHQAEGLAALGRHHGLGAVQRSAVAGVLFGLEQAVVLLGVGYQLVVGRPVQVLPLDQPRYKGPAGDAQASAVSFSPVSWFAATCWSK